MIRLAFKILLSQAGHINHAKFAFDAQRVLDAAEIKRDPSVALS